MRWYVPPIIAERAGNLQKPVSSVLLSTIARADAGAVTPARIVPQGR